MTIYLMTGTPGSGKSLHMAENIYHDVRMKRPVIANFEINTDMFRDASSFRYIPNDQLTPQTLAEYSREYFKDRSVQESKIRVYIDECAIKFNARDWNSTDRREWVRFFQLHRKFGIDVFLVSQYDMMLDKQIRALVEYEMKHRKVNNVGWVGKLLSALSFGHAVCVSVMYWYPLKMRLSADFFIGRKKFYEIYDTYLVFEK